MNPLYVGTANALVERITALIPEHPEILEMDDPWGLFKIPEFACSDLEPSFFQASWALQKAQEDWKGKPKC